MRGLFNRVISHIQRQFHSTIENKTKQKQNKFMDKEKVLTLRKLFGISFLPNCSKNYIFLCHLTGHVKTV